MNPISKRSKFRSLPVLLCIVLLSSACNATLEIGLEHTPAAPAVAAAPSVPAAPATSTSLPPASPTSLPSATPLAPTNTPLPVNTALPTSIVLVHSVQIYLIAIDDQGQGGKAVGCGDSLIPVTVEIPPTQGVLRAALESLLSVKSQFYGQSGLYNALYQSDLKVDSVTLANGTATVNLSGTLTLGGECDNPRVQAQLEQTVLQFPTVTQANIFINGKALADVLSLKG